MQDDLPTVEECREFFAVINRGREAAGLPTLDVLDYDACEPGHPYECLSAYHLFNPLGYSVGPTSANNKAGDEAVTIDALATAIGGDLPNDWSIRLPDTILAVTDVFDAFECPNELRARMVEAGVVDP